MPKGIRDAKDDSTIFADVFVRAIIPSLGPDVADRALGNGNRKLVSAGSAKSHGKVVFSDSMARPTARYCADILHDNCL
jgi:hypothetical protein